MYYIIDENLFNSPYSYYYDKKNNMILYPKYIYTIENNILKYMKFESTLEDIKHIKRDFDGNKIEEDVTDCFTLFQPINNIKNYVCRSNIRTNGKYFEIGKKYELLYIDLDKKLIFIKYNFNKIGIDSNNFNKYFYIDEEI